MVCCLCIVACFDVGSLYFNLINRNVFKWGNHSREMRRRDFSRREMLALVLSSFFGCKSRDLNLEEKIERRFDRRELYEPAGKIRLERISRDAYDIENDWSREKSEIYFSVKNREEDRIYDPDHPIVFEAINTGERTFEEGYWINMNVLLKQKVGERVSEVPLHKVLSYYLGSPKSKQVEISQIVTYLNEPKAFSPGEKHVIQLSGLRPLYEKIMEFFNDPIMFCAELYFNGQSEPLKKVYFQIEDFAEKKESIIQQ